MSATQKLACEVLNEIASQAPTLALIRLANGLGLVWTGERFVAVEVR